jgi:hypothetical protein
MSTTKTLTLTVLSAGFSAIMTSMAAMSASAQNYPNRPIRLVVPFPPAGSNNIVGRTVVGRWPGQAGRGRQSRRRQFDPAHLYSALRERSKDSPFLD